MRTFPTKAKTRPNDRVDAVPKVGVEPTLPEENYALNVARLPVPPLRHSSRLKYSVSRTPVNTLLGEMRCLALVARAIMLRA